MFLPVIGAGLVALVGLLPAQSPDPTYGLDSIRIDELRTKVSYLSSDDFRGRGNGTPELDEAARYIAGVFAENGLSPVGRNGYFQDFEVERLSLGEDNALEVSGSRAIRMEAGRDFIPFPGSVDGVVSGSLLFVGYGIRAPQLGYDDLEGVRLDGQIAVALEGHPGGDDPESPFNALSDQDFSDIFMKARNVEAGRRRWIDRGTGSPEPKRDFDPFLGAVATAAPVATTQFDAADARAHGSADTDRPGVPERIGTVGSRAALVAAHYKRQPSNRDT